MKIKFEWEIIHETNCSLTLRAKTIDGWLIKNTSFFIENAQSESMVFVSDRTHEWEIEK